MLHYPWWSGRYDRNGYEVTTAADGEEGLKIWKEQHPDVIVSDIEMPVRTVRDGETYSRNWMGIYLILFTSGRVLTQRCGKRL